MALREQLNNDLKAALLGGDRFVVEVLRNLKAAILNEEVAQGRRDEGLPDAEVEGVIAREVKKRHESRIIYEDHARVDLAENEQKEIDVLQAYLPEPLNETETQKVIDEVIATIDNADLKAMGQVISTVKARCGTAADGATVARLVKSSLQK